MTPDEYTELVLRTESKDVPEILARLAAIKTLRLLHSACGLSNESGELMEIVKKCVFYGKELDRTHLIEEYGDLLWYIAIGLDALGISMSDVMTANIAKLKARYADGEFDNSLAVKRDLANERSVLERHAKSSDGFDGQLDAVLKRPYVSEK